MAWALKGRAGRDSIETAGGEQKNEERLGRGALDLVRIGAARLVIETWAVAGETMARETRELVRSAGGVAGH